MHEPVQEQGIWMKRPASEIYKYSDKITYTFRKIILQFYGHIHIMNENAKSRPILEVIISGRGRTKWKKEVEEDFRHAHMTIDDVEDRTKFKITIKNILLTPQHKRGQVVNGQRSERKNTVNT